MLSEQHLKLRSNIVNWKLIKIYNFLVSRIFFHIPRVTSVPRNTVWETPVQHVFVTVCTTKLSPIDENRVVALGRTDIPYKCNGIFSRLFCKTHITIVMSICKFDSPQYFSLHLKYARCQITCYAHSAGSTWRRDVSISLVSVSHHCAAWLYFVIGPLSYRVAICECRNKTDNRILLPLFMRLNIILNTSNISLYR
jgi:hypothetical protein